MGKKRGNSRNFWRPCSCFLLEWNKLYPKLSGPSSRCPGGKIPTLFPRNHSQFPWSHPKKNSWKNPSQENQGREFPWIWNFPGSGILIPVKTRIDPEKAPWPRSPFPILMKTFPRNISSSQQEFQQEIPSQIDSRREFQRKIPGFYLPGAEV